MLSIDISCLPSRLITALKRTATFANPKFFELQRLRFSTWKTPRYIFCGELTEYRLKLPRGNLDEVMAILQKAGSKIVLQDARVEPESIDTHFIGRLMDVQESALAQIENHDIGVLVAPPGSGKTVIACALIGKRKVRTLILVHRKQLADQWKSQLFKFLELKKNQVGSFGGRIKSSGVIDIGMLQTVSRSTGRQPIRDYDQIIVDECHHVPAVSFENVLKNITARQFLGLTATPYRKDGHQAIIRFQCGPIRHTMGEVSGQSELKKRVVVRETKFRMPDGSPEQPSIHEIWSHLVSDSERLRLIAEDVSAILVEGRLPLILSERKDHLELLKNNILETLQGRLTSKGFLLSGDIGKRERSNALKEIKELRDQGGSPFILSTGSLIGEGFDMPELCTLVLSMPISFKGRIIQYAGRIHRESPGKTDVAIYDYVDIQLGLGRSMFRKRLIAYKKMGYSINYPDDSKMNYSAASSGVSQRTEIMDAASGGESDPSRLCQKPR
jgi:superfamily II DNA or RNA helicase